MRVKILHSGVYAKFDLGKINSQELASGDMVDFPANYAASLVEAGLAAALEVIEMTSPQIVVEQKLTSDQLKTRRRGRG